MIETGFGDATPEWFAADMQRSQRAAHEALQVKVKSALAQHGDADGETCRVLRLIASGNMEAARKAAPDRKSRWPVFRLLPDVAATLWEDTAQDFARTVARCGPPSGW